MGKKSLLAPTSKGNSGSEKRPEKEEKPLRAPVSAKKAAPKPKKKKPAAAAAAKKKAASKKPAKMKAAADKSSQKKKAPAGSASTAKASAKPKAPKTAAVKKKPAAKMKPVAKKKPAAKKKAAVMSTGALLKRKFDMPASGKMYSPPPVRKGAGDISSPPFFIGETEEETDRVRRLLFKKFDAGSGAATSSSKASWMDSYLQLQEKKKPMDPMRKMAIIGLSVLVVLMAMVLWTSITNNGKFYIKSIDGRVEIWEGSFSPKGRDKLFTFSSVNMPAELKAVYSREEAYPIIFEGVLAQADALLSVEKMPDFEHIRGTLEKAEPYAVSREMSDRLQRRLDKIDMMALVYKADILAGKGTAEDLASARESLAEALHLKLGEAERELIQHQIDWIDQKLAEAGG